ATGAPWRVGYRSAHWIADFQSIKSPEWSPPEYRRRSRSYIESGLKDAQRVVLSSENAREHCAELYPQYLSKVTVLPFRVARMLAIATKPPIAFDVLQKKYELPERYFIVCNQFWRNKNHVAVFRAAEVLRQKGVEATVLCTGEVRDNRDPSYG